MLHRKHDDNQDMAPQPTPFDIGLNGTVNEFLKANEQAKNKKEKTRDRNGDLYYRPIGAEDQQALQDGALRAFKQGRVDNVQTLLSRSREFKLVNSYAEIDCGKILSQLIEGSDSDRAGTIITLAIDKVTQEKKQNYLDSRLLQAVDEKFHGLNLVAALLKAGANANVDCGGFKGVILAQAIQRERGVPLVELLYKNDERGTIFNDALLYMNIKKIDQKHIRTLKFYREKITGEPATIEVDPKILLEMRQMIADLTTEVKSLKASVNAKPAQAQKKIAPPTL